jgi:poly(beta-D-mannuronate) lyase
MNIKRNLLLTFFLLFFSFGYAHRLFVKNIDELNNANDQARPGDTIVLKNGEWKDITIKLSCTGSENNPIVFIAETPGKVHITGHSQLKIGGAYIVVQGLYFTNGYSGKGQAVIEFRTDKDHLANHCRVTGTSVNSFNNPKRMDDNDWVSLYGKNNRIDHCSFENKLNMGVLLAVLLDDDRSRQNFHSIDHNYFGKRLPLASNGGEIIRVGLAQHAHFNSNTQITDNFFEYCDGEAEIISIKSGENLVRGNVFKESQGSVVLRHGDNNTVESNIFWGNGKAATGGVRVVNKGQWIANNFFYKCTGVDFRAPLSVMNGIPNSPPTRYVQVQDAVIVNNTFYQCAPFSLCEGSDAERTLPPAASVVANNIIYNPINGKLYDAYDKLDGISFSGNLYSGSKQIMRRGFSNATFTMQQLKGLQVPSTGTSFLLADSLQEAGKARLHHVLPARPGVSSPQGVDSILQIAYRQCGARWYAASPVKEKINFVTVNCSTAEDIYQQLAGEKAVHIKLTSASYNLSQPLYINKPVKFSTDIKSAIQFNANHDPGVFVIGGGGWLQLQGIHVSGEGLQSTHFICNDPGGSSSHYSLLLLNCTIEKMNGTKDIFYAHKSMVADSIVFKNNRFVNSACDILLLNSEKDDRGYYAAEKIAFEKNILQDIRGTIIDAYRGGPDESTLGPDIKITSNSITSVVSREAIPLIQLYGVQRSVISNNQFKNCNSTGILIKYADVVRARHILGKNSLVGSGHVVKNKYVL